MWNTLQSRMNIKKAFCLNSKGKYHKCMKIRYQYILVHMKLSILKQLADRSLKRFLSKLLIEGWKSINPPWFTKECKLNIPKEMKRIAIVD